MRRLLPLLLLLMVGAASGVQAQVAVPEIGPGSLRVYDSRQTVLPSNSIVPENPAALAWGAPTHVAFGGFRGTLSTAVTGTSTHYRGTFGGLRWVGPDFALAGGSAHYTADFPSLGLVPHLDKQTDAFALAVHFPSSLAWGVRSTHYHAYSAPGYPLPAPISNEDTHGWTAGASWRMGEHAFLGGAYGEDTADLNGTFTGRADRRHYMVGAGLRGGGTLIWHLEADHFRYENYTDHAGFIHLPGYQLTQYSAEGILGSWLFAYTGYALQDIAGAAPKTKGYSADFGFSPLSGLNLTWRYEQSDSTDNTGVAVAKQELNAVTLAWLF